MMTQNQAFEVISDSPASGEVNLEQYVGRTYVLYKHAEASRKLQRGSINILEVSFHLEEQKRVLKRKEYKKVVVSLDLEGEDKKYVKVGKTFLGFDPLDLALVEPDTIFLLAKNSKKYQPVIEQLKNETNITQKRVRELINDYRKLQKEETSDDNNSDSTKNVSVWRRGTSSKRYCQIGAIHEDDDFTGVTIQRIVEEKHVLPQTVVRNAMSLVEAYESAQLVWVNSSTELNNYEAKSFFDVREMNTLSSVEAPNYISPCIDSESQLPKNEELNETRELGAQQESEETITSCDSTCRENDHPYSIESGEDSKQTLTLAHQNSEGLNIPPTPYELIEITSKLEVNDDVSNSAIGESTIDNLQMNEPVVVVSRSGADSELEEEAAIIAEYLSEVKTWEEAASVMQNCPSSLKSSSWQLLSEEQKARIRTLKHEFEISNTFVATDEEIPDTLSNQKSENSLQVGDKVMWDNCYPYLQSWQPFIICRIEGDKAKLDYYANLVPLAELSLAE